MSMVKLNVSKFFTRGSIPLPDLKSPEEMLLHFKYLPPQLLCLCFWCDEYPLDHLPTYPHKLLLVWLVGYEAGSMILNDTSAVMCHNTLKLVGTTFFIQNSKKTQNSKIFNTLPSQIFFSMLFKLMDSVLCIEVVDQTVFVRQ